MGKCVCDTAEEVRKCQANCDVEIKRRYQKKNKYPCIICGKMLLPNTNIECCDSCMKNYTKK